MLFPTKLFASRSDYKNGVLGAKTTFSFLCKTHFLYKTKAPLDAEKIVNIFGRLRLSWKSKLRKLWVIKGFLVPKIDFFAQMLMRKQM
jgi:hypothetical protein